MHIDVTPQTNQLIQQYLQSGKFRSHDELLSAALHSLKAEEDERQAIEAGIAQMSGVMHPLEEVDARLRMKHSIALDA